MQSYDSVRFPPQVHKRMELEFKQLELRVKQSCENQGLEVDRQQSRCSKVNGSRSTQGELASSENA